MIFERKLDAGFSIEQEFLSFFVEKHFLIGY